jgi:hypothetical protein
VNNSFSSVLDAPQALSQLQDVLNFQAVGIYEQHPQHYNHQLALSVFISHRIADFEPDLYAQKQPEDMFNSSEQLFNLQRSYTFLSDGFLIADVLAKVPVLYILLKEAVEQLHCVFGQDKLLQLEALASDDDTVLRVMVKLSKDTETPAALMRKFKQDWWLKNCSQTEASLVFDYEIGNGF